MLRIADTKRLFHKSSHSVSQMSFSLRTALVGSVGDAGIVVELKHVGVHGRPPSARVSANAGSF